MRPTAVILVVGLNQALLPHAPRLSAFARAGRVQRLRPVLPAVTCSVQASMLTGQAPGVHGIVGNGWYDRELAEVQFWKQSNHLVHGPKVWDLARQRDPSFTCAQLFWWFNMYAAVDWAITPRPIYKADGRKLPDVHTFPGDLRERLQAVLGTFPLFNFWGPASSIASTRWIADAALFTQRWHHPTLTLIYLPHLDYALQKLGPDHPAIPGEVAAVDAQAGRLIDHFQEGGVQVLVASEYGIESVSEAIHINRHLRQAGLIRVRVEQGLELLDPGASAAFAVADHQIAHLYASEMHSLARAREVCAAIPGVTILAGPDRAAAGLDHPRAGDLVLVAPSGKWFTYYYWLDDQVAPDFARTVDIHRKPGYDPVELFLDPALGLPKLRIAWKLLKRRLGQRALLDIIPLDAALVRGSHGRTGLPVDRQPILISPDPTADGPDELPCTALCDCILAQLCK